MPTPEHESIIRQYTAAGYRKHDFAEFLRLAHFLEEHIGDECDKALARAYKTGERVTVAKAASIAAAEAGVIYQDYIDMRKEMPAPKRIPDAWAFKPSAHIPGRMEFHVIEVTHHCPPDIFKLSELGKASDQLERHFIRVTEISARTGEFSEHDPLYAWHLLIGRDCCGVVADHVVRDAEASYAARMSTNVRLVG